jgi:hypothetical protein
MPLLGAAVNRAGPLQCSRYAHCNAYLLSPELLWPLSIRFEQYIA